ncbi:cell differentiation family, Rcd1-like-domain-containing protein [Phlyctochytrium arcticum]|nr:cell differentiation family, Rcd1-like-domain-containing protein [Phlyctochytrium arcticum]
MHSLSQQQQQQQHQQQLQQQQQPYMYSNLPPPSGGGGGLHGLNPLGTGGGSYSDMGFGIGSSGAGQLGQVGGAGSGGGSSGQQQPSTSQPPSSQPPSQQQQNQPPQQQQQLPSSTTPPPDQEIYQLILDLTHPTTREQSLLELSKKREAYEDLAPILWHAFGVMAALLQEIVGVYPMLMPPTLTGHASNRVCNALALLQCVASHNETRGLFLNAHIPLFLYPFLNTTSKTRPFEYLRLTSLGVIGALVKVCQQNLYGQKPRNPPTNFLNQQNDNSEVISFLLSTEIIPLCLRIMETGSELSKTVAIFIVQKILLDDMGLLYICQTYERFYAVGTVLSNMVAQLVGQQSIRLLKHVIRCYLRLSDNVRAREALRQCLPEPLRDSTFKATLKDDMTTKRCLATLLLNLGDTVA